MVTPQIKEIKTCWIVKMKILKGKGDINFLLNTETDFLMNLGSEENLQQFEGEVLRDIINPIENYEVVRYIHEPYDFQSGLQQSDIWYYFYFLSGNTYVQDYSPVDISYQENELLLKQSTKSFFRLEFYKTPGVVTNNVLVCEPPNKLNRKLVFTRDLSLPLGEKFYYNTLRGNIHVPVFNGNNYSNKENMYLFWFENESVLEGTNLSGTTTGNTFFMTAKFFDAKNGQIIDFINFENTTGVELSEEYDFYYQVDFNYIKHTYKISTFKQSNNNRIGLVNNGVVSPIKFYQKGVGSTSNNITPYNIDLLTGFGNCVILLLWNSPLSLLVIPINSTTLYIYLRLLLILILVLLVLVLLVLVLVLLVLILLLFILLLFVSFIWLLIDLTFDNDDILELVVEGLLISYLGSEHSKLSIKFV